MSRRNLLRLFLVALLVFVTTWLSQKGKEPKPTPDQAGVPITTYFIRGLDATVTTAEGLPSHHMKSDALLYFADSDHTELKQPQLTVFLPQGEQWQVEAADGRIDGQSNQISLEGTVILTQRSDNQPLKLETDHLQLYPETRYGESDTLVTVSAPSGRISGVGMQLYGDERRLLLLSEVQGHYDTTVR